MTPITSLKNPLIQQIKKLHFNKYRQQLGLFVAEGMRTITTMTDNGYKPEHVFFTEETADYQSFFTDSKCLLVPDHIMGTISSSKSPSGILAIFPIPKKPQVKDLSSGSVLAQISDPGNMGTLIRTTAAMGLKTVVCIESVDPWNPKVIQASAGTIAAVNIFQIDWQTLIQYKGDLTLSALVVSGGESPEVMPKNTLIVIGNEATGIPDKWIAKCDQRITLSMPGKTESLNAAVAGAIALYLLVQA
ncbi:hypothetical protein A3F06_03805 [candidate division TM6 bacterium RIFCSPHIGHO2_12_FULL_36_22]|nr:MAG: hypothetical protein A3F06_03805 [candidate division TM6 bacterium RIFCSPHIGHO2_12_FULL_36_22]